MTTTVKDEKNYERLSKPFPSKTDAADAYNLFSQPIEMLSRVQRADIRQLAMKVIFKIAASLETSILFKSKLRFGTLTPLHITQDDDGSILVEWAFPHYRIGFSIESDTTKSGWYLITDKHFGETSASGRLNQGSDDIIIRWITQFVLANS